MADPTEIHKSGFRIGTRNLILSGIEAQFDEFTPMLQDSVFEVTRVPGTHEYSEIPELIPDDQEGSYVYLVLTRDTTAMALTGLPDAERDRLFGSFDSVLAVSQMESEGLPKPPGVLEYKVYGEYVVLP